ncbi:NBS-LRR resistance-like protein [Artemisia annua]|uniref:NBS-LRR resistance-like protein n=1 Tax=Artemisia annua TaxID=35608 RepID=A0A2U1LUG6_ARTAN|nr:NBS-LRR resistance-like protein [Artemisia annua]
MAEIIVSPLIEAVFRKLANEALKQVVRAKGIHAELKNLGKTLSDIQDHLSDASEKEVKEVRVQKWLNGLQHLTYDIDDLLDDLATEAIRSELTEQSGGSTSIVRKLIPSCCTNFSLSIKMRRRLDDINNRLQDLEKEKVTLGLTMKSGRLEVKDDRSKDKNRQYQTSLVDASSIVGRQGDKEALVVKLLGDEPCNENFSIVPIVGLGGVGKTTLAKMLYEDEQVNAHFEFKAWVCVSDEWDTFGMSNIIFQSVTGEAKEFKDLNLLQVDLRGRLKNKLFLLVLDDVWSESSDDWESLVAPLKACAPGIIVSPLIEAVFRKLANEALKQVVRAKGIHAELKNLGKTLSDIQDHLSDASDKEVKEVRVQKWLNGLQHLTYDIDDLLDDLATEAIRSELTEQSGGSTSIVRKLIPSCCTNFSLSNKMRHRLDNINNKLQDLEKEKVTLGLTMKSGRLEVKDDRSKDKRPPQTSLVDASSIVGRQGDKDALVVKLLGDEPCNENFSIVPIVGLGGVGKTTLAKMLYEDEQVNAHFEFKAWLCVSDEWDTFGMSNIIFQSVTGETKEFKDLNLLQVDLRGNENFSIVPIVGLGGVGKTTLAKMLYEDEQVNAHFEFKAWVCVSDEWDTFGMSNIIFQSVTGERKEFEDLNLLQVDLRDRLKNKLFMLVLDDVWSESSDDWESLVAPLKACAPGSKIIVTTRKEKLLTELGCGKLNHLKKLSHDDAVCLFAHHAFGANNFDSHPRLKAPGEGIVRKCDGLPLALIALGRLLRRKNEDEIKWKEIEESEIWSLEEEGKIIPALRLSYRELPAYLKQLFAYCSLFPKDYAFEKEDLVLLWMAEGFLHQVRLIKSTTERFGLECFDELLSRSFFQHSPNDESLFVMHDLMNDLATSVAGDFFFRLEKEMGKNDLAKFVRHMSFIREEYGAYKKFEGFKGARSLRTVLSIGGMKQRWQRYYLSNKVLVDLLPQLQFLRVLSLSGYEISEVPDSIGKLKHLRYLNLSQTAITRLPENVCDLYNLETLILFGCSSLTKLPNNFIKLKSLRHLDIRDTPLLEDLPLGIGELKSIQTLSKIIIGGENDFSIKQLKDFENLQGKISFKGLEKVRNATEAREACLSQKRLTELEVEWSDVSDASQNDTTENDVLDALKPYNECLKRLGVVNYPGLEFPKWVGDPSFRHLARVSIRGCKKCTSLPPLGQLQSLKELAIQDMGDVKVVGSEFSGTGFAFPSLEVLSFEGMQGWEVWSTNGTSTAGVIKDAVFPHLKKLHIIVCPNLGEISLKALPSLRDLRIRECGDGVLRSLVHAAPSVTKLDMDSISGLTNEVWRGVTLDLKAVEELEIKRCGEIRYLWESKEAEASSKVLVNLSKLILDNCKNLVSLGEKDEEEYNYGSNLLTSLRWLQVWGCENFKHLSCPNNIETLQVWGCNSITSVSFFSRGGGQKLKSFTISKCEKLLLLEELGEGGEKNRLLINSKSMPMLEFVLISSHPNVASIFELGGNFIHLTTLIIQDCKSTGASLFADLQLQSLTSLTFLDIRNCPSMDVASGLWPPNLRKLIIGQLKKPISEWGPQKFPSTLVDLTLDGGTEEATNWSQLSHLHLPSSLTRLCIGEFHNLETVSEGLQHLTSLQHLEISSCPKIKDLPEMGGGQKLRSVTISDCKKLLLLKEELGEGGEKNRLLINSKSMPMLEYVDIYNHPNVASIFEFGGNFIHLTTLIIQYCKSTGESLFPDHQLQSLTSLTTLIIQDCQSMDVAAGLWPPNLRKLTIGGLKKPISEWGPQKFPTSLVDLTLWGETEAATIWSQLSHLHLPSSLTRLRIRSFDNLETVSEGLQHLTSLQHLEIRSCPKIKDLPETLLHSLLRQTGNGEVNKYWDKRSCCIFFVVCMSEHFQGIELVLTSAQL